MADTTNGYIESTKALTELPKIALIFSEYDDDEVVELLKSFNHLQERSETPHGLFHFFKEEPLSAPTKLAGATNLLITALLVRVNVQNEIANKTKLSEVYQDVMDSYLSLAKYDDHHNKINTIAISNTISQLENISTNDEFNLKSLQATVDKVTTTIEQLHIFINQAKEEGKAMTAQEVNEAILNDRDTGVIKTINVTLNNLRQLIGFIRGNEVYIPIRNTYDRAAKVFQDSPQKALPVLPILNLMNTTYDMFAKVNNEPALKTSTKQEMASKIFNIETKLCQRLNEYFDNLSNMKANDLAHTLDTLNQAVDEYSGPNFSKLYGNHEDEQTDDSANKDTEQTDNKYTEVPVDMVDDEDKRPESSSDDSIIDLLNEYHRQMRGDR